MTRDEFIKALVDEKDYDLTDAIEWAKYSEDIARQTGKNIEDVYKLEYDRIYPVPYNGY
jgi:hypothetical protein